MDVEGIPLITMKLDWANFKSKIDSKYLAMQGEEYSDRYDLWALEASAVMYRCSFIKGTSDSEDFEANYKSGWNKQIIPVDSTGRPISRTAITQNGWHFDPEWIEIKTSKLDGVVNVGPDGEDLGQCSVKLFDAQGAEITAASGEAECVKTVVTFTPQHESEPLGGAFFQANPPDTDVRFFVTAFPDTPYPVRFGNGGVNFRLIGETRVLDLDGRATKFMPYYPGLRTWEFLLTHNPGVQHEFAILLKMFNA